ncbi:anion exchange protein 3 isoform X3 [Pristis pectinata]|uniref:anion exchange protein 3 isoform X3 n=1 Tax=Pristis pectinata TaxID=685728 RepID=UPI00223E8EAF|nr:anion exchange protein 3 isoform X3 [Pristis pectinata]
MATSGSKELENVPTCSEAAEDEVERSTTEEEEEEELDRLLAVECLGDLLSDRPPREPERSYSEKDFEYHRRTSLHIHHPLSTRLPPNMCFRRKVLHSERKRKKRRKKKKTSVPPSEVTPTIQEVDEEEEEGSEVETLDKELSTSEEMRDPPKFHLASPESMESLLTEDQLLEACVQRPETSSGTTESCVKPSPDSPDISPSSSGKRRSLHRLASAQRASYDLRERVCIGSMTALGPTVYQKVPTDEAEAQMLASVDLDHMKSHRFEDNPGVRRHLVKKPSRSQMSKTNNKMSQSSVKKNQLDRKPHEVFVELNELVVGKNNEMTWQETARWIKFEEDVESETDRWGKPHVASLTFRSLLELRKTIAQGAVLLDLEQKTLPGIAHLVVETMVITDQIKAEDRANVLRALLVKHSHPNDEKEGSFFPRSGNSSMSSVLTSHHVHHEHNPSKDPFITVPLMGEERVETQDPKTVETDDQKNLKHPTHHSERHKTKSELKLLKQIPDNAEATVVLIGTLAFLEQPTMAFVRLSEGVLLESVLEVSVPVRFIFVLLGPAQSSMDYHEIGRSISTLMSDKEFHEAAYLADDRQDLLNAINEFLDCSIVIPPLELEGKDLLRSVTAFQKEMLRKRKEREQKKVIKKEESLLDIKELCGEVKEEEGEDDPLERTNLLFGGLMRDIKRRYPKYLSDIRDVFNCQCLAAIIFIYFAALSPAITFGGLLGTKTEGLIGVSELIVSTSAMGIFFSLLGAQPLLVIGFTGPLLVFEEAFYNFSKNQNIDYLTGRVWIGFWLMFIVLITVAFEGSLLVRYVSPFTQEIFAFLISAIFIYETLKNLCMVFSEHPLLKTYPASTQATANYTQDMMVQMQPNTALLSLVLMVGTFFTAYFLRKFRNSRFLGGSVRRIIGDFGIPIAILVMLIVDTSVTDTYTEKLNVPLHFSVTSPDKRSWFIHPLGKDNSFPLWMIFGAAIPALLLFILIFMETNITTLIVSKKERRLVKGSGFHLDLLLIGVGGGVCGLFGLPWQTAATVRTIAHVNALTVMSKSTAPGEKFKIEEVKEQRITGIMVALLVGLSVVMSTVLRMIPMAVLFGIFLYMGVTSLTGTQLYERLLLMFIPAKFHPDHIYVTKVRTWKMNLFTSIQLACIVILWVIKSTIISLAFPFFLILTVPTRCYLLPRIFQERELLALDCDEMHPNFDEDGHDEYSEMHMPL